MKFKSRRKTVSHKSTFHRTKLKFSHQLPVLSAWLLLVSFNYVSPYISCRPTTAPTYFSCAPFVSLTISISFNLSINHPDWPQIDSHAYSSKPKLHKADCVEREQLVYIIYHHFPALSYKHTGTPQVATTTTMNNLEQLIHPFKTKSCSWL